MAACGALGEAEWLPVCRVVCPRCTAAKAPKADVVHTAGAQPVILQAVKTILGKPPWDAVCTGGDVVRGKSAGHCVFTSAHRQGRTLPACGALEKVRTSPVRLGTACISQADKTALGCRLYRRDIVRDKSTGHCVPAEHTGENALCPLAALQKKSEYPPRGWGMSTLHGDQSAESRRFLRGWAQPAFRRPIKPPWMMSA